MSHHHEPNWQDVAWNHHAAAEAMGALRRAADELDRTLAEEARPAQEALGEWRGASRSSFERRRAALRDELSALAAACRQAVEQVRRADADAAAEQRRREWEREEWRREEERREREREEQRRRRPNAA
jgi:ElaB/YqjD/DUF883 family membrane-anchored ribosome-binding protein